MYKYLTALVMRRLLAAPAVDRRMRAGLAMGAMEI
nr:MAG TPA: hypothetical protein [Caudoviricetes sp.]